MTLPNKKFVNMSYYSDGTWWVDYLDLLLNTVIRANFQTEKEATDFYNALI